MAAFAPHDEEPSVREGPGANGLSLGREGIVRVEPGQAEPPEIGRAEAGARRLEVGSAEERGAGRQQGLVTARVSAAQVDQASVVRVADGGKRPVRAGV